jgi:hypothetical protein
MKRDESDPGDRCTVEYVWMGHIVGPLADPSVIMRILVILLFSRWDCLRSLFCPAPYISKGCCAWVVDSKRFASGLSPPRTGE